MDRMISVFSRVLRIRTQFCLYAGNMDQRKSVFWHISRSVHQKKKKKKKKKKKREIVATTPILMNSTPPKLLATH